MAMEDWNLEADEEAGMRRALRQEAEARAQRHLSCPDYVSDLCRYCHTTGCLGGGQNA